MSDVKTPEPLTDPPLVVTQRLVGGTFAVIQDGVFWIQVAEHVVGYSLDEWRLDSLSSGVLHDGDEVARVVWTGKSDEAAIGDTDE